MKPLLAMGAMLALAACETGTGAGSTTAASAPTGYSEMYPLLDNTGTIVGYAPPSAVQNTPPGTAMRININGREQTVTLGPRVSPPTSAGTAVIIGTRGDGSPIIGHIGAGQGNLAPGGTPVVTGTRGRDNRPVVTYVPPGQTAPGSANTSNR